MPNRLLIKTQPTLLMIKIFLVIIPSEVFPCQSVSRLWLMNWPRSCLFYTQTQCHISIHHHVNIWLNNTLLFLQKNLLKKNYRSGLNLTHRYMWCHVSGHVLLATSEGQSCSSLASKMLQLFCFFQVSLTQSMKTCEVIFCHIRYLLHCHYKHHKWILIIWEDSPCLASVFSPQWKLSENDVNYYTN